MIKFTFLCATLFLLAINSVCATNSFAELFSPVDPDMIYGNVRHANTDKPIKDVSITVIHQLNNSEKIFQTNTGGDFGINNLVPGTYKLVFQKEGYRKVVKDKILVKSENTIELQIEMEETRYDLTPSPFHFFKI